MSSSTIPRRPVPKYRHLREVLLALIRDELSVNEAIPSEYELQDRYGMSRMTVRKAVDQLVAERILYRVSGVGTFVAERATNVELHLSSFSEDMAALGRTTTQRVLALREIPADEHLARELATQPGEPLVHLERLRCVDDMPVCQERSYVRKSLVPGFPLSWGDESLFEMLDQRWDLRPTWAQQRISATSATGSIATGLSVRPGAPLLKIRQRAFKDAALVEYCESFYPSDGYELSVTVNRSGLLPPAGEAGGTSD